MIAVVGFLLIAAVPLQTAPSTVRVTGRVLDADTNEPLAGTIVAFLRTGTPLSAASRPIGPLRAETGRNGIFTLDVPPGHYRVLPSRAGFVSPTTTGALPPPTEITGPLTLPDIRLERGGSIEGRILDERGRAMPGVMVTAVRPPPATIRGAVIGMPAGSTATTNDLGEFRVTGVPTGNYYILARQERPAFVAAPTSSTTFVNTYFPGLADLSGGSLVGVTAGNTTRGVDFQMLQAPVRTVSGMVVDREGRAVAGAVVRFNPMGIVLPPSYGATSQRDGTFTVPIPDGRYLVAASISTVISNGRIASTRVETAPPPALPAMQIVVEGYPISGIRVVIER